MAPHTSLSRGLRSGKFGGQRSFSMSSEQFACSHSCVTRAVCAGAPSCWKMNPAGINCLQSSISLISILCTGTHELLLLLRIPVQAASAFAFCPHATPFPQPCKFSYKNSNSLLGYQPNTAWDYFFLPHPVVTLSCALQINALRQSVLQCSTQVIVLRKHYKLLYDYERHALLYGAQFILRILILSQRHMHSHIVISTVLITEMGLKNPRPLFFFFYKKNRFFLTH